MRRFFLLLLVSASFVLACSEVTATNLEHPVVEDVEVGPENALAFRSDVDGIRHIYPGPAVVSFSIDPSGEIRVRDGLYRPQPLPEMAEEDHQASEDVKIETLRGTIRNIFFESLVATDDVELAAARVNEEPWVERVEVIPGEFFAYVSGRSEPYRFYTTRRVETPVESTPVHQPQTREDFDRLVRIVRVHLGPQQHGRVVLLQNGVTMTMSVSELEASIEGLGYEEVRE